MRNVCVWPMVFKSWISSTAHLKQCTLKKRKEEEVETNQKQMLRGGKEMPKDRERLDLFSSISDDMPRWFRDENFISNSIEICQKLVFYLQILTDR